MARGKNASPVGNIRRLRPQAAGHIVAFRERTWPFAAFVPNSRPFALPGQLVRVSRGPGSAAAPAPRPRATSRDSPPMPHSEPGDAPFRPYPSHRSGVGSTSLLGMAILRWGAGGERRFSQQPRHLKVNIMKSYRKFSITPPLLRWGRYPATGLSGRVLFPYTDRLMQQTGRGNPRFPTPTTVKADPLQLCPQSPLQFCPRHFLFFCHFLFPFLLISQNVVPMVVNNGAVAVTYYFVLT